ncbi:MAG: response regulator, partial [Xanthomonadales bacterium]|nr:response regulator [Xanthomonadales bacterium]
AASVDLTEIASADLGAFDALLDDAPTVDSAPTAEQATDAESRDLGEIAVADLDAFSDVLTESLAIDSPPALDSALATEPTEATAIANADLGEFGLFLDDATARETVPADIEAVDELSTTLELTEIATADLGEFVAILDESATSTGISEPDSDPQALVEVLDLTELEHEPVESIDIAPVNQPLIETVAVDAADSTHPDADVGDALAGAVDDLDAFLAAIGVPSEAMDAALIDDFDEVASIPEIPFAEAFSEWESPAASDAPAPAIDALPDPVDASVDHAESESLEVEASATVPAEVDSADVAVAVLPVLEPGHDSPAEVASAPVAEFESAVESHAIESVAALEIATMASDAPEDLQPVAAPLEAPLAPVALAATAAPIPVSAAPAQQQSAATSDIDPPGELDLPDLDRDLLEIFVQEGGDIIDAADSLMMRLREQPEDRDTIVALQRELHTLKGSARMTGLTPIGDLTHAMESLFEAVADGRAKSPRGSLEYLERSFDRLNTMVQRVARNQQIATPTQIVHQLELLTEGLDPNAAAAETPATVEVTSAGTADAAPAAAPAAPPAVARTEPSKRIDDDDFRPQQQEMIRVRADLIDNLVNFAGEVSIYRSRLEAQIGGFRFNLQEFDATTLRLRDQLRKLEMETEAQILSRFQREAQEDRARADFDPLELDRFSTLQQLSRALAESVSDLISLQNLMDDIARQSETLLLQQSRVSSELQEGLMRTRMVPFESVVPRLRRIVRQTAAELGKKAQLKVEGAQGEMDRTVLERMTAPLEHMLRNALAHGLEQPDRRLAVGKPEEGTITILVAREGTEVVIKVSDDGAGMNRNAIRARAIERGLLRPEVQLSDRDLFQFIMESGFSTAESVSKVAGRGVGMDVVHNEVKMLGGNLQIDSSLGRGSLFTVRLPFTLAITQAVMIKLADHVYAVPMSSVSGVMRMQRREFDRRLEQNQLEVTYAGDTFQIYDLGDLLAAPIKHAPEETQVPLLMTKTGDQRAAIRVSHVIGGKEIVVKSVGPQLSAVPGFFGATIMGDGSVVVILDLAPLVRHGLAVRQAPELAAELDLLPKAPEPEVERNPLIMVVDDSITMRKVTTRVLERHNLDVITAKDGLDAVEQLQDRIPDVVLLDIEMPRMDGYELATYIRNDPRLKHLPLIMITSRTGDKHRQRALEIGVDRYLGKPYQETDLVKNVQESLAHGRSTVRQ